jgi:hypothetical protein
MRKIGARPDNISAFGKYKQYQTNERIEIIVDYVQYDLTTIYSSDKEMIMNISRIMGAHVMISDGDLQATR